MCNSKWALSGILGYTICEENCTRKLIFDILDISLYTITASGPCQVPWGIPFVKKIIQQSSPLTF